MSKFLRIAVLFIVATACTPNVSSACWALPLPWHCGWSWNPFDPCGVYSSNCASGHCGIRRGALLANRQNRQAFRANRRGGVLSRVRDRRTNRVCNRCARLQRPQCNCGTSMIGTAAMCGAGFGTMAAGPVPVTTQVPVTTYRTVTVDRGSYQRVWVPNIVTQRVPQTTYQNRTVWMNQPQDSCGESGFAAGALLPAAPLQQVPMAIPSQLPLGSPYSGSTFGGSLGGSTFGGSTLDGLNFGSSYGGGIPIESSVPLAPSVPLNGTILGPTSLVPESIQPTPEYDGVPYPPQPAAARPRPMRSASTLGLSTGIYSDGITNYVPRYQSRTAPTLPGLSIPPTSNYDSANVVDDYAVGGDGFDDWVNVEPSTGYRSSGVGPTYEPKRYEQRSASRTNSATRSVVPRRSASGMFSPVRPGTGIARARFTGR